MPSEWHLGCQVNQNCNMSIIQYTVPVANAIISRVTVLQFLRVERHADRQMAKLIDAYLSRLCEV